MIVKLYIYRTTDGLFLYEDVGSASGVIYDIDDNKDFTLTPPPDSYHQWRWQDDKWITDETA